MVGRVPISGFAGEGCRAVPCHQFVGDLSVVLAGDQGQVDVTVTGAVDLDGLGLDPSATLFENVFMVTGGLPPAGPFAITAIIASPLIVEWESTEGYSYTLQSSLMLTPTNWVYVWSGVAPQSGTLGYTNGTPVDSTSFYRVLRDE